MFVSSFYFLLQVFSTGFPVLFSLDKYAIGIEKDIR